MTIDDIVTSPFNDLIGFKIAQWEPDHATLSLAIRAEHLNRSGSLHGGVLMTLIDAAGGYSGCYCTIPGNVRRALSLSLTTNFTGQTRAGMVRAVARKRAGGRRVFFAGVDVWDEHDQLIATGDGTYRYRSGSETPEGSPEN